MKFIYLIFSGLIIIGCQDNKSNVINSPTSGEVHITADESIKPLIDAEINSFVSIYKNAKVTVSYKPESEAFSDLLNDSSKMIFVYRELNLTEKKQFEEIQYFPKTIKIAEDAIALIINKKNQDSVLTKIQLRDILTGKITDWKQINPKSKSNKLEFVFDNKNSSSVRYLIDSVSQISKLPENCFALNSNPEVIEYVKNNAAAIGVIGLNWISDRDDSTSVNFRNDITVVALEAKNDFYKPYQAYIKLGYYPLSRKLVAINREGRAGLATGFSSFVAGDKGQRIILKSGLVPSTMPIRLVELKENSNL